MLFENIRLAFSSLVANKMRALLTMLGIIIGIASVIAIMTVGNSVTGNITESMESLGVNNVMVSLQQKNEEKESREDGVVFGSQPRSENLTEEDLITTDMIREFVNRYPDKIKCISAQSTLGDGQALDGNLYANASLLGVSLGYFVANDLDIIAGRYFSEREFDEGDMVIIVSDKLVNNMFKGDAEAAVGKTLQFNVEGKFYHPTIVGVYEHEDSPYMISMTSEKDIRTDAYLPLRTVMNEKHITRFGGFTVVTATGTDPDELAGITKQFFNVYYRNNRNYEISAFSMATMVSMMSTMMGTVTTALSVIAGIALLVGGIGVMNIMLVSITERTREIGTRKALGAPNGSIRTQFIVESIVICVVGGIIGIIIGVSAGMALAKYLGTPAKPDISSILLSIGFSSAIGVFFGYYPANKAAKMDPIEALRYE